MASIVLLFSLATVTLFVVGAYASSVIIRRLLQEGSLEGTMDNPPIAAMHFSRPHHVDKRLRAFVDNVERQDYKISCNLQPFKATALAWVDAGEGNTAWLFASVRGSDIAVHGMFNIVGPNGSPLYFTVNYGGVLYINDAKERASVHVTAIRRACETREDVWKCYARVSSQMHLPNLVHVMPLAEACLANMENVYVAMVTYTDQVWVDQYKVASTVEIRGEDSHEHVIRFVTYDEV